jgi:hypothetical protein
MADQRYVIEIELDDKGFVVGARRVTGSLDAVNESGAKASVGLGRLESAMFRATTAGAALGTLLADLTRRLVSWGTGAMRDAVALSAEFQNALIGLSSIARSMGQDVDKAKAAAVQLASDGLMSVNEAARGLKNLLASGFGLDRAIGLMTRFKDIAAFNRQGFLSFGEAIVSATEGIKNQNSILIDNMGLTKNYSVILREIGLKMEDLTRLRSDQALQEKVYQAFIRETLASQGDAVRLTETYSGAVSRLSVSYETLLRQYGDAITQSPAVALAFNEIGRALTEVTGAVGPLQDRLHTVANALIGVVDAATWALRAINLLQLGWNAFTAGLGIVADRILAVAQTIREAQLAIVSWGTALVSVWMPSVAQVVGEIAVQQIANIRLSMEALKLARQQVRESVREDEEDYRRNANRIDDLIARLARLRQSIEATRGKTISPGATGGGVVPPPPSLPEKETAGLRSAQESLRQLQDRLRLFQNWRGAAAGFRLFVEQFGSDAKALVEKADSLKLRLPEAMRLAASEFERLGVERTLGESVRRMAQRLNALGKPDMSAMQAWAQAWIANLNQRRAVERQLEQDRLRRIPNEFEVRRRELARWREDELAALNKSASNWSDTAAVIEARYQEMLASIAQEERSWTRLIGQFEALANSFQRLSQVTGGTVGRVTGFVGQLASTVPLVAQSVKQGVSGVGAIITKGLAGLGAKGFLQAGLSAASGFASAFAAVLPMIEAIFSRPAWKDVMRRVGRDWGVAISEGLAKEIAENAKRLFGGSRQAAEIFALPKIIAEAGGVTAANFDTLLGKLRDVFVMVKTGAFTLVQARTVLDQSFSLFADHLLKTGQVASRAFVELLDLNARMKTGSLAIQEFVLKQVGAIGSGMTAMLSELTKRSGDIGSALVEAQRELLDAQSKLEAAMADDPGSQRAAEAAQRLESAIARVRDLQAQQGQLAAASAEEVARAGRLMTAAFNAAIAKGADWMDVLSQLGGGLDALLAAMENLGMSVEDSSVAWIVQWRERVNANKELVASAQALDDVLVAMSTIGALNAETFADLNAQAQETFDQLIARGFTSNEALAAMSKYLYAARDAHQRLGLPIDENTQRLIEQAEEAGLLEKQGESLVDVLKTGFGEIIRLLGGDLPEAWQRSTGAMQATMPVARDVATAIEGIGQEVTAIDWDAFAREAVAALGEIEDAANRAALGRSPGGVKEIPSQLERAEATLATFRSRAVEAFADVEDAADAVGLAIGRARDELDDILEQLTWDIEDVIATPLQRQLRRVDRELASMLARLEPWRDRDPARYLEAVAKAQQLAELKARELVWAERNRQAEETARQAARTVRVTFPRPAPARAPVATLDPVALQRLIDAFKSGLVIEVDGFEIAAAVMRHAPTVAETYGAH